MANFTTNYNLKKPLQSEYYNVEDFNGNADILDEVIKGVYDTANKAKKIYILAAAADSNVFYKDRADYVCNGTNDSDIIRNAVNAAAVLLLAPGTYNIDGLSISKDNITVEGFGKVNFVLSERINVTGHNVKIKNISFSHTEEYEREYFIILGITGGKAASDFEMTGCTIELSAENDAVFNNTMETYPALGESLTSNGLIRFLNNKLICSANSHELIKPHLGTSLLRLIAVGNFADAEITVDPSKLYGHSAYGTNAFELAGNVNFVLVESE